MNDLKMQMSAVYEQQCEDLKIAEYLQTCCLDNSFAAEAQYDYDYHADGFDDYDDDADDDDDYFLDYDCDYDLLGTIT